MQNYSEKETYDFDNDFVDESEYDDMDFVNYFKLTREIENINE